MNKDTLWNDVLQMVRSMEKVPTLKGQAEAKVISVEDNKIDLELDKGKVISIVKNDFEKALNALEKNGRVRQRFVKKPLVERYVLGLMKLLPSFEDVKEYDGDQLKTFVKFK